MANQAMAEFLRPSVLAKLDRMVARRDELNHLVASPEVLSNPARMRALQKEAGSLHRVVATYDRFRELTRQIEDNRSLIEPGSEPELAELARAELPELERAATQCAHEMIDDLLADVGQGDRNAIVEIRAGTGGEEAALWARDLFQMYGYYAQEKGWRIDLISEQPTEMGGAREIIFSVSGDDVFKLLRFESGGHRVQRVPATESQGRVHTSAATIAVLPEAEEVEVEIAESDLEFQAVRASGPGGQNVNKVSSAVRLTHRPSGLVVFCQEERSQLKNKQKALKLLRSRLYDAERQRVESARSAERRSQVGTGDRNARIRTYNFPQNRLTDHRIGQNFSLDQVLEGKLSPVVDALLADDRARRIEEL